MENTDFNSRFEIHVSLKIALTLFITPTIAAFISLFTLRGNQDGSVSTSFILYIQHVACCELHPRTTTVLSSFISNKSEESTRRITLLETEIKGYGVPIKIYRRSVGQPFLIERVISINEEKCEVTFNNLFVFCISSMPLVITRYAIFARREDAALPSVHSEGPPPSPSRSRRREKSMLSGTCSLCVPIDPSLTDRNRLVNLQVLGGERNPKIFCA